MKRLLLIVVMLVSSVIFYPVFTSADGKYACETDGAFAEEVVSGVYSFDLLCQPVLLETLEIDSGDEITVTVDLSSYYAATGQDRTQFSIHLAMQRANVFVDLQGSAGGQQIVDSDGRIQDVLVRTEEQTVAFTITNAGWRSAVFDLSVRPR